MLLARPYSEILQEGGQNFILKFEEKNTKTDFGFFVITLKEIHYIMSEE